MRTLNDYQLLAGAFSGANNRSAHAMHLLRFLGMDGPAASELAETLLLVNDPREGQPQSSRLLVAALGVAGEAGEFADAVKKTAAHGHPLNRDKLLDELGDVLWYVAENASALGATLEEVAARNVAKLKARYPDGFSSEASQHRAA